MSGHAEPRTQAQLAGRAHAIAESRRAGDRETLESLGYEVYRHPPTTQPEEDPLFQVMIPRMGGLSGGWPGSAGRYVAVVEDAAPTGVAGLRQAFAAGWLRGHGQGMLERLGLLVVIRARSCSTESAQLLQRTAAIWLRDPKLALWFIVTGECCWYQGNDACNTIQIEYLGARRERVAGLSSLTKSTELE